MKKILTFILTINLILFPFVKVRAYSHDIDNDLDLFNDKAKTVQVINHANGKTYITNNDIHLMAKVVYAESRGEPYSGKVAVASVILNRVEDPKFPKSIKAVIMQPNAFSCIQDGKINVTADKNSYRAVLDALKGMDPTNKALFFYNPKIATCNWMKHISKKNLKTIGNHVFFAVE